MSTGPEHFERAEFFAGMANEMGYLTEESRALAGHLLVTAQVHATLALAAATLDAGIRPVIHAAQWTAVLGGEEIPALPA